MCCSFSYNFEKLGFIDEKKKTIKRSNLQRPNKVVLLEMFRIFFQTTKPPFPRRT